MILVDGNFKYNETVAIDVNGELIKRKVHYADGELFVNIDGKRITENDLRGAKKYNASASAMKYIKKSRDKISILAVKGTKERWKAAASDRGKSLNAFVIDTVNEEINK